MESLARVPRALPLLPPVYGPPVPAWIPLLASIPQRHRSPPGAQTGQQLGELTGNRGVKPGTGLEGRREGLTLRNEVRVLLCICINMCVLCICVCVCVWVRYVCMLYVYA